jgi:hypothetical protein
MGRHPKPLTQADLGVIAQRHAGFCKFSTSRFRQLACNLKSRFWFERGLDRANRDVQLVYESFRTIGGFHMLGKPLRHPVQN